MVGYYSWLLLRFSKGPLGMYQHRTIAAAWIAAALSVAHGQSDSLRPPAAPVPATRSAPSVAVLSLVGQEVDSSIAQTLAEAVSNEMYRLGTMRVIERSQIQALFKEKALQQSGCEGTDCYFEMGKLLGTERIVIGSVGRVGNTFILNLRLVEVASGEVLGSSSRSSRGPIDALLVDVVPLVVRELAGERIPPQPPAPPPVSIPSPAVAETPTSAPPPPPVAVPAHSSDPNPRGSGFAKGLLRWGGGLGAIAAGAAAVYFVDYAHQKKVAADQAYSEYSAATGSFQTYKSSYAADKSSNANALTKAQVSGIAAGICAVGFVLSFAL